MGFPAKEMFLTELDIKYVWHTYDMCVCICVHVYILASVCQQLLQLAGEKIESGTNNFDWQRWLESYIFFPCIFLFDEKLCPGLNICQETKCCVMMCVPYLHVNSDAINEMCV